MAHRHETATDVDIEAVKLSIEDAAFAEWDGEVPVKEFVADYLDKFPGFAELWEEKELAETLENRR
jgi:hypothetical protein